MTSTPALAEEYQTIRELADKLTPEQADALSLLMKREIDYEKAGKHFDLWSTSDKIINFTTPENTAYIQLEFVLPVVGEKPVLLDQIKVLGADVPDLILPPINYPVILEESKENAESIFCVGKSIPVQSQKTYTVTFRAKLKGKLPAGLRIRVIYFEKTGQELSTFPYVFNRKSSLGGGQFCLNMQCDAIVYKVTRNPAYAQKVKREIDYFLNDFLQGIEHWLVTNERPEGCDAYGAVQGGRLLCSLASALDLMGVDTLYSPEEKSRLYRQLEYFLDYMLDLRDRTELPLVEAQRSCTNWQLDMCAGTAMLMLVLPDFPHRKTWLHNAAYLLEAMLNCNLNPDGSWPESIRYHFAALIRLSACALVLQNGMGENWFTKTGFIKMYSYPIDVQTPRYAFLDNAVSTPPFGDHVLQAGSEFALFAQSVHRVREYDKGLADRMYYTWLNAGKPKLRLFCEDLVFLRLLAARLYEPTEDKLILPESISFPDGGIHVFRKRENYFAFMSSPRPIGHGHLDQGSFQIFADGVPVVLDSGIEGYFDGSVQWHLSSYSHGCVQFSCPSTSVKTKVEGFINLTAGDYSKEKGWLDTPRQSTLLDFQGDGNIKTLSAEIHHSEGKGRHIRTVCALPEENTYLITDTIESFSGDVLFSLPLAASSSVIEGQRVTAKGLFGHEIEVLFLHPLKSLTTEKGRSAPHIPSQENSFLLEYIRAVAEAKNGFQTIIHIKKKL